MPLTCELCHMKPSVHKHHVFGAANRKHSEKWGMVAYLCYDCHALIHDNYAESVKMKERYQRVFEADHSHAEFMAIFGRNYIGVEP